MTADRTSHYTAPMDDEALYPDVAKTTRRESRRAKREIIFGAIAALSTAAAVIMLIVLLHYLKTPCSTHNPSNAPPTQLYAWIPLHKQQTDYTCGPSSALAVYQAFGFTTLTEEELAASMKTTSSDGTNASDIVNDAVCRGFVAMSGSNLTIEDLKAQLVLGHLTVIGYQAWKYDNQTYPTDWEDGHYSTFMGYNATGVFLMDPWQEKGFYGYVPNEALPVMWHFYDTQPMYSYGLSLWFPGRTLDLRTDPPSNVLLTP
jgi:hypothetical protein